MSTKNVVVDGDVELNDGIELTVLFLNIHTASALNLTINGKNLRPVKMNSVSDNDISERLWKRGTENKFIYDAENEVWLWGGAGLATSAVYGLVKIQSNELTEDTDTAASVKLVKDTAAKYLPLTGGNIKGQLVVSGNDIGSLSPYLSVSHINSQTVTSAGENGTTFEMTQFNDDYTTKQSMTASVIGNNTSLHFRSKAQSTLTLKSANGKSLGIVARDTENFIANLSAPTTADQAANKGYVDKSMPLGTIVLYDTSTFGNAPEGWAIRDDLAAPNTNFAWIEKQF